MAEDQGEELAESYLERRRAYRAVFDDTPVGKEVMADLFHICCGGRTTFEPASRDATLINEGKRQVYLHILSMVRATDSDIWDLALQQADRQRRKYQGGS